MTTESAQAGQDAAAKIWAEMDAEEAGKPATAAAVTPVVEQQPAKTESNQQAAAPAAPAADASAATGDPEKQVLLDKINGLESQLQQMTGRVRKVEGRYGELNSQLQQTARDTAASGAAAPSASEIRAAQANPEKMVALKRDYPEFGAAMEAALDEGLSGLRAQIGQLERKLAQGDRGVTTADVANLRNELTVELSHAGWKDTVVKPEFTGWLSRQPREVQMLAASDSPQDAIRLLDLHAETRKAAKPNNNQRLESAAAIPAGRSSSNHAAKPVEEMNKGEYWRYLDQQEASQRSQQG